MGRVKTGIRELDEMLCGGFLEGDAVMVAGGAGTGKTTLALQYLANGIAQYGENGVYVTFEQLPSQIYRDAKSLGLDLQKIEEEGKFRMVCTSPNLLLESNGMEQILDEPIKEVHAKRIVIDSLSHLAMFVKKSELRKDIYQLLMFLKTKGLSSLIIWEASQAAGQSFSVTEAGMSFLVDCIISLRFVEIESSMKKALMIMKMRGSDHDKHLREYQVTSNGLSIFAPFDKYEGIITGTPRIKVVERFVKAFK